MIKFKKDKIEHLPLKKHYIFAFIFNGVMLALVLLSLYILPPEIPLYYGLPISEQQLTPNLFIALPTASALLISIFNAYLSTLTDGAYLKKILAYASVAVSILASITTLKIIFLVGNI